MRLSEYLFCFHPKFWHCLTNCSTAVSEGGDHLHRGKLTGKNVTIIWKSEVVEWAPLRFIWMMLWQGSPPAFSHLLERQTARWQPRDQHRNLFGVLKRSVTAAPNVTALRGDSVSLETLNPYLSSPDPSRSPLLRGCWTTTLCRGKDGKISAGCAPIALCEMRGLYAAASHVGKVGGWKKRSECSHCTAALTSFDKKDSVTGLSIFF